MVELYNNDLKMNQLKKKNIFDRRNSLMLKVQKSAFVSTELKFLQTRKRFAKE